jgi:NADH-quinone oxidoreductase subunit N
MCAMWGRRKSDDAGRLMIYSIVQGLFIVLFFLVSSLNSDFNKVFYSNNLFFYSKIFLVLLAIVCIISISVFFCSKQVLYFEFAVLFLLSIQSMLWMLSVNDLFLVYLCFELQAFCFYILVAFHYTRLSSEASLRFFIYGAFSSSLFLLGICFLYGYFGTCEFSKLLLLCDYDVLVSDGCDSGLLVFGVLLLLLVCFLN